VEQRIAVERRVASSPALQEARRQKLPYEKLRVLAKLPDRDIGSWIPRARALSCIELHRAVDGDRERQMRGRGRLRVPMPRRLAVVLAAALEAVRVRADHVLTPGRCLALVAWHFLETWKVLVKPRKTRSRQVRDRDGGHCQVPGCSHRAAHSHHLDPRSHGGSDDPENQVALCPFHHLRCVHGGWLRVVGTAPHALTWFVRGRVWTGPAAIRSEDAAA
jgi:hypothetical protein